MNINKKTILYSTAVIAIIIIAAGSFYGGTIYSKKQNRQGFQPGSFQTKVNKTNGSNFISGTVISKDDTSITLQMPNNGGSKIIFYSESTQIGKFTSGSAEDINQGQSVSVAGSTNSDGSITAQSIQIRPEGQMMQGAQNQMQPK